MQRNSRLLPFEEQLALVHGKINYVNMADDFARYRDGLLYYWNRAEELHLGAQIIHDAHGPHDVFVMLAGLSLEVLLKGIHRALDNEIRPTHRLDDLCRKAGISVSSDDQIILAALSEHVTWASRYPVPNKPEHLWSARKTFDKQLRRPGNIRDYYISEREISWANYERLWEFFAGYYHRAREARPESAELWFNGDH
jgi:HEPN domain-containing protein